MREIALPAGTLGIVFEPGATTISAVRAESPLRDRVLPGERVVAPACRRSWLASDGLSFAASGTAATRRLSAVSAAFPSPRLCQPAANVEPGPAKPLVPKRAGRKAFGVVNR